MEEQLDVVQLGARVKCQVSRMFLAWRVQRPGVSLRHASQLFICPEGLSSVFEEAGAPSSNAPKLLPWQPRCCHGNSLHRPPQCLSAPGSDAWSRPSDMQILLDCPLDLSRNADPPVEFITDQ